MAIDAVFVALKGLKFLAGLCYEGYKFYEDNKASIKSLAAMGVQCKSAQDLFIANRDACSALAERTLLLEKDLNLLKERAVSESIKGYLELLQKKVLEIQDAVKENIMDPNLGSLQRKAWIAKKLLNRKAVQIQFEKLSKDIDSLVQNLSLSIQISPLKISDSGALSRSDLQEYLDRNNEVIDAQTATLLQALEHGNQQVLQEVLAGQRSQSVEFKSALHSVESNIMRELEAKFKSIEVAMSKPEEGKAGLPVGDKQLLTKEVDFRSKLMPRNRIAVGLTSSVYWGVMLKGDAAGSQIAFKKLDYNSGEEAEDVRRRRLMERLSAECKSMSVVNNPNCVRFLGACVEPPGLIYEYCNSGSLSQWLWESVDIYGPPGGPSGIGREFRSIPRSDPRSLTMDEKIRVLDSVIKAMSFLHHKGLVHKTLKSSAILVNDLNVPQLVDPVRQVEKPSPRPQPAETRLLAFQLSHFGTIMEGAIGFEDPPSALRWKSPELAAIKSRPLDQQKLINSSTATDIYSFGALAGEVFLGLPPYKDVTDNDSLLAAISSRDPFNYDEIARITGSPKFANLIKQCCDRNPLGRPTLVQISMVLWPQAVNEIHAQIAGQAPSLVIPVVTKPEEKMSLNEDLIKGLFQQLMAVASPTPQSPGGAASPFAAVTPASPVVAASPVKKGPWKCGRCQTDNEADDDDCTMCGQARPTLVQVVQAAQKAAAAPKMWVCARCKCENGADDDSCLECGAPPK